MESIVEFFRSLHGDHLRDLLQWGGFALITAIVFAETGLLVGFFLPGDSLLFTAGALVGTQILAAPSPLPQDPVSSLVILDSLLILAAVAGDSTGYWFGWKTGPRLFARPNSRLFKREHLERTRAFYARYGRWTIILAKWVPFARTFAPVVSGVAEMPYVTFVTNSAIGAVTWVISMTLLGFYLGSIEFVRQHNEKVILGIILLSLLPAVIHTLRHRRALREAHAPADAPGAGE